MRKHPSNEMAKIVIVSSRRPKCENNVFDANTIPRIMNYIDEMKRKHNAPIGEWLLWETKANHKCCERTTCTRIQPFAVLKSVSYY